MHPKGANSMSASRLSCIRPLVGTGWTKTNRFGLCSADYGLYYCLYPVHGFENASVMVDEGDLQVAFAIRLDIKGNTMDERRPVTNINFTVTSTDISTGKRNKSV